MLFSLRKDEGYLDVKEVTSDLDPFCMDNGKCCGIYIEASGFASFD